MLQITENIKKAVMFVGITSSNLYRVINLSASDISVLNFPTEVINYIESEPKRKSKRIASQTNNQIQPMSETSQTGQHVIN